MTAAGAKEVALELNSLSKSQNMAGWRIGMLVAASKRIEEVLRFKSNMDSGMFLPLQLAAAHALDLPAEWYAHLNETYRNRRERVFHLLEMLGCAFDRRQAGLFVWASVPANAGDGFTLSDELLRESRVFLTPGGIFGHSGKNYLRVSLCCPAEQVQAAEERIRQYLGNKSRKHV
jgi:aspartate/methionine/tyrosine aminotransferase